MPRYSSCDWFFLKTATLDVTPQYHDASECLRERVHTLHECEYCPILWFGTERCCCLVNCANTKYAYSLLSLLACGDSRPFRTQARRFCGVRTALHALYITDKNKYVNFVTWISKFLFYLSTTWLVASPIDFISSLPHLNGIVVIAMQNQTIAVGLRKNSRKSICLWLAKVGMCAFDLELSIQSNCYPYDLKYSHAFETS